MKKLWYSFICIVFCLCTSCAKQYQIPEEYDLQEDCSEWNICDEEQI